jgi:hypothetical protein
VRSALVRWHQAEERSGKAFQSSAPNISNQAAFRDVEASSEGAEVTVAEIDEPRRQEEAGRAERMCDLPMSDADGPRFGEPLLDTFTAEIPDGLAVNVKDGEGEQIGQALVAAGLGSDPKLIQQLVARAERRPASGGASAPRLRGYHRFRGLSRAWADHRHLDHRYPHFGGHLPDHADGGADADAEPLATHLVLAQPLVDRFFQRAGHLPRADHEKTGQRQQVGAANLQAAQALPHVDGNADLQPAVLVSDDVDDPHARGPLCGASSPSLSSSQAAESASMERQP